MRLIDADPLGMTDMEIIMCDGDYKEALKMLIDKIEHAPTIEERKTGKWEKQRETYCSWECSVCKEIVVAMPERMGYPMYDYCPNCGARMEGNT